MHRRTWNTSKGSERYQNHIRPHGDMFHRCRGTASCRGRQRVIRARRKQLCNSNHQFYETSSLCAVLVNSFEASVLVEYVCNVSEHRKDGSHVRMRTLAATPLDTSPSPLHHLAHGNTMMPAHTGAHLSWPPAFSRLRRRWRHFVKRRANSRFMFVVRCSKRHLAREAFQTLPSASLHANG